MPLPLSATSTTTPSAWARVVSVISPFAGGSACAALVIRFRNTWLICDGAQVIVGISPNSCFTLTDFEHVPRETERAVETVVQIEAATLLRSRRLKSLRLPTISAISPVP